MPPKKNRLRPALALAPLALAAAAPVSAQASTAFYGVTSDDRLVEFTSDNTMQTPALPVRGLQSGEHLVGLDMSTKDGRLYGLTSLPRIVVVNPRNAAVTSVGGEPLGTKLTGTYASIDVNPVLNRIRLETNAGQNLVIDPATGQLAARPAPTPAPTPTPGPDVTPTPAPTPTPTPATTPGEPDANLAYPTGDPAFGRAPKIQGIGYTNSFPAGGSTELFGIDATSNTLVKQAAPSNGVVQTVGALGVTGNPVAFDVGPDNWGYAAVTTSSANTEVGLWRVNLITGKADKVSAGYVIGTSRPIVALAAAGSIADDDDRPGLSVSSSSTQLRSRLLSGGLQLTVNCDEACEGTVRVRWAGRTSGTETTTIRGGAGYDRVAVDLDERTRDAIRRPQGALLRLSVEVEDGAGNRRELERPIRTR